MEDEFNRSKVNGDTWHLNLLCWILEYEIVEKIGEGTFSDVLKVKEKRTGITFAAKRLTKAYTRYEIHLTLIEKIDAFFCSKMDVNDNKELEVLQKLENHPNVVGMIDSF